MSAVIWTKFIFLACVCVCLCVYACVCAYVHACVRVCVHFIDVNFGIFSLFLLGEIYQSNKTICVFIRSLFIGILGNILILYNINNLENRDYHGIKL